MRPLVIVPLLLLGACQTESSPRAPGSAPEGFTGIGADETVQFTGTEPFWGGSVTGSELLYKTPENIDGTAIAVKRFTGQGGLGYSGKLNGAAFDMTITPGACSDQMSDRSYPYTVTLRIGDDMRRGCAWTAAEPFDGPEEP
tara:strand:- start:3927 stop:4352 length:426 start_codon:yes stop_codon:yes gene_type:complete